MPIRHTVVQLIPKMSYGSLFWPDLITHSKNYEVLIFFSFLLYETRINIHFSGQENQVTSLQSSSCDEIHPKRDKAREHYMQCLHIQVRLRASYECVS